VAVESPIEQLLQALDGLDVEAVISHMAPDGRFLTADGHRAEGTQAIREVLVAFLAGLRSMTHRITAQWHQDDAWIAEVEADYELRDWLQLKSLPRAFILRQGPDGITELNVYGAHEHPLSEHRTGDAGMWIGERWIPPL
jgi:hypothetical protein